jgi:hypothetical protein
MYATPDCTEGRVSRCCSRLFDVFLFAAVCLGRRHAPSGKCHVMRELVRPLAFTRNFGAVLFRHRL